MKAKKLISFLALVVILTAMSVSVFASDASVANQIELRAALEDSSVTSIILTSDIEFSGEWTPVYIGTDRTLVINGNGNTISNMVVRDYLIESDGTGEAGNGHSADYRAGFIGTNLGTLTINDLIFVSGDVDMNPLSDESTGSSQLAIVCGFNSGTLIYNNVQVDRCSVKGYNKISALLGHASGGTFVANKCTITNTSLTLEQDGSDSEASWAAPIVGFNQIQTTKTNGVKLSGNLGEIDESVVWEGYEIQTDSKTGATYIAHDTNGTYSMYCDTYKKDEEAYEAVQFVAEVDGYQYETLEDAIVNTISGDTITLMMDIELAETIEYDADKAITIDLNGKELTTTASILCEITNGTITLADSCETKGKVHAPNDVFYIWGGETKGKLIIQSEVVVKSDTDCCVVLKKEGATLISEGELSTDSTRYGVIQGNGNTENGGIEVYINGGSVSASNNTAIYFPGTTKLEITDGKITGKVAVYQKSGTMKISGGTFEATGEKVDYSYNGDGCNETGDAVIVESCNYPGGVPTVEITGGYFSSVNNQAVASYVGNGVSEEDRIVGFISGGYFSSNPTELLTKGKVAVTSDNADYAFMVSDKNDEIEFETTLEVQEPVVEIPEGVIINADFVVEESVLESAAADLINDENVVGTKEEILDKIFSESEGDGLVPDANFTVVVKPYIDIVVVNYVSGESKEMTLEISAKYDVVAILDNGPEFPDSELVLKSEQHLDITTPIEMVIALPDGLVEDGVTVLYVYHEKDDVTYVYEAEVNGDTATFTNPHGFSTFVVKTELEAAAKNSATEAIYTTLEAAISEVENEGVIVLLSDNNETVEIGEDLTFTLNTNGYTFSGDVVAGKNTTVEKTEDAEAGTITYVFDYTKPSTGSVGGGAGSSSSTYTVKFETNGGNEIEKVKVDKKEKVEKPEDPVKEGYTFDGWYKDEDLTDAYDFDSEVTKSFTLYAKWTQNDAETSGWKNPFVDVKESDWFYDSVKFANEKGLFNGISSTEFGPNVSMTRGMLVTVLYRLSGADTTKESAFVDVASGMYYSNAVAWAADLGVVNGVGDNKFAPDALITREQLATIMFRYMEKMEIDLPSSLVEFPEYNDASQISAYAVDAVRAMRSTGLMEGKNDNNFDPKGTALRSEVATLLMRFCK